ncbi:hypothetical protein OIU34_19785 [Pararhizobium sp. BT-229]|uniref:hypothetical protein n=1 Tax=Pararhizobium sp. BT-229 TaxID=2986923 RepID=UPI0021F7D5E5|nr:hypothetical protein [Pararhizobium sp. BT-229]MCV9964127.1 hypothetical protein [Pararhizobium sp. BT-229]
MMDIVEQIEAILDRATQDFDGKDEVLRRAAAEIKALRSAAVVGYLYDNEDTGREFAEQHPVESGEVPDATNVVPGTAEAILAELLTAWKELGELRQRERDAFVILGEPTGYLKPSAEWTVPPYYITANERTEEWARKVFTEPLYAPAAIQSLRVAPLRFAKSVGDTLADMRDNIRKDPLYAYGDAVLVWLNQGDLINHQIAGTVKEAATDET